MRYKGIPTLDLHGSIVSEAKIAINDFILEQYALGHKKIIIIHGDGKGIIRKTVHDELHTNKLVSKYKLNIFNFGSTVVEIKD
jgi:dsDNA-specific endonuclease/ATPase MutS2